MSHLSVFDQMRVAIVGAGVIGLTTAVYLLEKFPGKIDLTLLADQFSPDTVSDKAGAIIIYSDFNPSSFFIQGADIKRWMSATCQKFHSIFTSADNAQVGISLVHGYTFWTSHQPEPWWKDLMHGFRHVDMESTEAKALCVPPDCVDIWTYGTYSVNPTYLLQWLMGKARKGGCKVEKRKISSLNELTSCYDIVINCTGLSSCNELLTDQRLFPIRGQAVIVKAPWVKHWVAYHKTDGIYYVLPRASEVLLGGTYEVGNWSEITDSDTISNIVEHCQDLIPSLCGAEVVHKYSALRPGRDIVRLEGCEGPDGNLLIHCYGHGGSGIVLSWGCAMDIGDMLEQRLRSRKAHL